MDHNNNSGEGVSAAGISTKGQVYQQGVGISTGGLMYRQVGCINGGGGSVSTGSGWAYQQGGGGVLTWGRRAGVSTGG